MYAFIKGTLTDASPLFVVIDSGGIGYKIFIPAPLFTALPPIGNDLRLYTSFVVRELSHQLYGFVAPHERDLFETLMGVTGVGQKLSLSII
jgi:Holliday junction DNA helicase RuvA